MLLVFLEYLGWEDVTNFDAMITELIIAGSLASIIFYKQWRQGKKIENYVTKMEDREKKNKEYLEGQIIRALSHIRHESRRANEELERMSGIPMSKFDVVDMIWNPLGTTASDRLATLNEASNGLIDAVILDKINAVKEEIKIDLHRNVPMAMVQCIGVIDLITNLFNGQLNEERKKVIKELNEDYENRKKSWADKGFSEKTTESQRIWIEAALRKYD